jgi:predicted dehydrogenase
VFAGTNLLWEINGTRGDLQVTATTGHLQMSPTRLRGAQGFAPIADLSVSAEFRWVPDSLTDSPAYNVAQAYIQVAAALAGRPNSAPTFRDAIRRHAMLDAIAAVIG